MPIVLNALSLLGSIVVAYLSLKNLAGVWKSRQARADGPSTGGKLRA